MNRLGKILTLGRERRRVWQLPVIAGLLFVFGLGVRWELLSFPGSECHAA